MEIDTFGASLGWGCKARFQLEGKLLEGGRAGRRDPEGPRLQTKFGADAEGGRGGGPEGRLPPTPVRRAAWPVGPAPFLSCVRHTSPRGPSSPGMSQGGGAVRARHWGGQGLNDPPSPAGRSSPPLRQGWGGGELLAPPLQPPRTPGRPLLWGLRPTGRAPRLCAGREASGHGTHPRRPSGGGRGARGGSAEEGHATRVPSGSPLPAPGAQAAPG